MSRKNNLKSYRTITAGDMSDALGVTSDVTNIQWLDNVGIQFNFTGNPTGTFFVEVSADYSQDDQGNIINPGNWIALSLSPTPAATGTPDSIYLDLNQLSSPWIRSRYQTTGIESAMITTVADVSGSLNNTYFLIDGADGDDWYVWFDNGTGVDPAIAGRTGVQVTYTDDDTANDIATALGTALGAVTSIENIVVNMDDVTFDQTEVGPGNVEDGAVPTGFTFDYTSITGVLNAYITAKML